MLKVIHRIPFLRLTAALAAGIFTGSVTHISLWLLYLVLPLLAFLLIFFHKHYSFGTARIFGMGVHLFFFVTGLLFYNHYNSKPMFFCDGTFSATVREILQEKPKTFQSVLEIDAFYTNDSVFSSGEKVLVYFEKDSVSQFPVPGQVIGFKNNPQLITNSENPFEFDYRKYMARKKIFRQVYLPAGSWNVLNHRASYSLPVIAERFRLQLLGVYSMQAWDEKQQQVMSALTLGYRRGIDAETRQAFASSGILHILAVSGLHTGILFLIVNFLFGFLKKFRRGRFLFVVLVVLLLWGFAFLTGLSPSVNRAAVMFSFLVVGQNLRRQLNIYNTLAASAFFLLLVNPDNLFEPGFQLSYAAVLGIVFLHPRIEKLFSFRLKVFRYFWSLFTISVAAQVATFPLSVYYFHQFPVYFWLTNLVAIPLVTLLIPLGIALLTFHWVPFLSSMISVLTGFGLTCLIRFPEKVEQFPFSTANLNFSTLELALVVAFIVSGLIFIEQPGVRYFRTSLMLLFLILAVSFGRQLNNKFRKEIIVYNYEKQPVLHLVAGSKNYIVSEEPINETDQIKGLIKNTISGLQLNTPVFLTCRESYHDSVLYLNNGFIFFKQKIIHFCHSGNRNPTGPFNPDYIIHHSSVAQSMGVKNRELAFPGKPDDMLRKPVTIFAGGKNGAFRRKW